MSATWRFYHESLNVISSVPEKSVRLREVSAIKDVYYKEVSLYFYFVDRPTLFVFAVLTVDQKKSLVSPKGQNIGYAVMYICVI